MNPISTCNPRGFGGFGGRNTAPTFAEVKLYLRSSGSHFLGRGGIFDPRPTFAAVGFHLRPTAAVKKSLGPRPENWSRDPPRHREDEGGGSRLQSAGLRVEGPFINPSLLELCKQSSTRHHSALKVSITPENHNK